MRNNEMEEIEMRKEEKKRKIEMEIDDKMREMNFSPKKQEQQRPDKRCLRRGRDNLAIILIRYIWEEDKLKKEHQKRNKLMDKEIDG